MGGTTGHVGAGRGNSIEMAGHIDTLAADKTGTLTPGRPQLVEICVRAKSMVAAGAHEEGCARAATPAGTAMADPRPRPIGLHGCRSGAVRFPPDRRSFGFGGQGERRAFALRFGRGDFARTWRLRDGGGPAGLCGPAALFEQEGIKVSPAFLAHAENFQRKGMSVALLAYGDEIAALGFLDTPRPETARFLEEAKRAGVEHVVMLSGDTEETVSVVARDLGVEYRAALMPQEKAEAVGEMVKQGRNVMMVGDGVNDAPSLAQATVGVAMGGLGSDIALNAADVVAHATASTASPS